VGVERGSHDGGRILYLGVVGKEKSPTVATMRLAVLCGRLVQLLVLRCRLKGESTDGVICIGV